VEEREACLSFPLPTSFYFRFDEINSEAVRLQSTLTRLFKNIDENSFVHFALSAFIVRVELRRAGIRV
jgi:hypothetical protein